jgi:hypothetical protein
VNWITAGSWTERLGLELGLVEEADDGHSAREDPEVFLLIGNDILRFLEHVMVTR